MEKLKDFLSFIGLAVYVFISGCAVQEPRPPLDSWTSEIYKENPLVGGIYAINDGRQLTFPQLVDEVQTFDNILIGEKHDNPDHQRLESEIIKAINPDAVIFEMLHSGYKSKLSEIPLGISEMELKAHLNWDNSSWNWDVVGPVIYSAYETGAKILHGNLSRDELMDVYSGNIQAYPTISSVKPQVEDELLEMVYKSHCDLIPKERLTSMVDVQLARDALMASSLASASGTRVLIAGAYHIQKDKSVPLHIRSNGDDSVSIALVEVSESKQILADYQLEGLYDYVVFTPVFEIRDYCKEMRESYSPKKNNGN